MAAEIKDVKAEKTTVTAGEHIRISYEVWYDVDYPCVGDRERHRSGVRAHPRPTGVLGGVRPQDAGVAGNRDLGGV